MRISDGGIVVATGERTDKMHYDSIAVPGFDDPRFALRLSVLLPRDGDAGEQDTVLPLLVEPDVWSAIVARLETFAAENPLVLPGGEDDSTPAAPESGDAAASVASLARAVFQGWADSPLDTMDWSATFAIEPLRGATFLDFHTP